VIYRPIAGQWRYALTRNMLFMRTLFRCRLLPKHSRISSTNWKHPEHRANVHGNFFRKIRWVLKDTPGIEFAPAARKTIDLEGRVVKEAVRKALKDRQNALTNLVHAIREYRKLVDEPITLRGSDYAHAVQQLNKAIDRAEDLLQN
jgi:hypothetical protein